MHHRRRMGFNRLGQHPAQTARGQRATGRIVHGFDRVEQLRRATTMQRGQDDHRGPVDETELIADFLETALSAAAIELVPLVQNDHDSAPGIDHMPGQASILIGDPFIGIEQQTDHIGLLHRLHCLDGAERLNGFMLVATPADARRIDQMIAAHTPLQVGRDRIPGRPGLVRGHRPLISCETIEQRRLTDIGASDQRQADDIGDIDHDIFGSFLG